MQILPSFVRTANPSDKPQVNKYCNFLSKVSSRFKSIPRKESSQETQNLYKNATVGSHPDYIEHDVARASGSHSNNLPPLKSIMKFEKQIEVLNTQIACVQDEIYCLKNKEIHDHLDSVDILMLKSAERKHLSLQQNHKMIDMKLKASMSEAFPRSFFEPSPSTGINNHISESTSSNSDTVFDSGDSDSGSEKSTTRHTADTDTLVHKSHQSRLDEAIYIQTTKELKATQIEIKRCAEEMQNLTRLPSRRFYGEVPMSSSSKVKENREQLDHLKHKENYLESRIENIKNSYTRAGINFEENIQLFQQALKRKEYSDQQLAEAQRSGGVRPTSYRRTFS